MNGLEANVKARENVETLLGFVVDVLEKEANVERFWELLAQRAAQECGKVVMDPPKSKPDLGNGPMSTEEAAVFETTVVAFGKYAGKKIAEVEPSYLVWLSDENQFTKSLRRYIKSRRFLDRQEDE